MVTLVTEHAGIMFYKDFAKSLARNKNFGGRRSKKADKALKIASWISTGLETPDKFKLTNHGEARIRHCVKFDLGDGFRLISQRTNNTLAYLFVGDHEECDKWLNKNHGIEFAIDPVNKTLLRIQKSNPEFGRAIQPPLHPSNTPLYLKLSTQSFEYLTEGLSALQVASLANLLGIVEANTIALTTSNIENLKKKSLVRDVFAHLASGNAQQAERLIAEAKGELSNLENASFEEVLSIQDGDEARIVKVGSDEYTEWLKEFAEQGDYLEWMLFMHPAQRQIVDEDFSGPSQLSGVSGSGKTCIAIQRAKRLAATSKDAKILLVTLNKSLSGLISSLVNAAVTDTGIRSRIKVTSFFELCQELLKEFEPQRDKSYSSVSWKLDEHIDEVFREYYRCWANIEDADILWAIHKSLNARGVKAENYVREEFDWVRSAYSQNDRAIYADATKAVRSGRAYAFPSDWRAMILKALDGWERKMEAIGVIDYLGLSSAVGKHLDKISKRFTNIIVDEAQDFGTAELAILRRMVPPGSNDIFLCGDIAQHVLPKHRDLRQAGIDVRGRARKIFQNYRNTREILEAAYHVLVDNLSDHMLDRAEDDLEVLDPKYASRSSNKPLVLRANSLQEEIAYALKITSSELEMHPNAKCCIAIAGYSTVEVERYANLIGITALDGSFNLKNENLVLSDLEQTKGYEFDVVIVLNCREGVLPAQGTLEDESFRDGCRLYVAMTRAKNELYLSYHDAPSQWLTSAQETMHFENGQH